jgi:2,2-dialkylglycine decarboxylase (pyruvate)
MPSPNDDLLARARDLLMRTSGSDFSLPVIERAEGAVITDVDGKEYLDFSSGQMCATLGHGHPRIVDAIKRSADRVMHVFSGMVSPEVVLLAQRVVELLPEPLRKVCFLSTGGESTEFALKLAKKATGKYETVSLADSFHGSTWGAASATFIANRRAGYGPTVPGSYVIPAPHCYRCPIGLEFPGCEFACARIGFDLVDRQNVGALAAVIAEPIQGGAGMVEPPAGYLTELRRLAHERDMLFVLDEAQTGLGRVGQMWGFEQDGAVPDIVAISKTLGGGIPLAAVATSPALEARAHANGFWFYTSHLNEPLPSAVGLAVIDTIRDEKLVQAARVKGEYLRTGFRRLQADHAIIGDVRGRGLLMGVDFVRDRVTKQPAEKEAEAISRVCLERGLFMSPIRQRGRYFVWRVAPPLTISYAEMDRALEIVDDSIRRVCGG